jgi:hypothetical protein
MRAEDLVFWLDTLSPSETVEGGEPGGRGALCRRHADSMVVPRNWTLDDLRDPDLHLFRPPAPAPAERPGRRRRPASGAEPGQQLELGVEPVTSTITARPSPPADVARVAPPVESVPLDAGSGEPAPAAPWTPSFDVEDDLDGLLAAQSPLLARAFRGSDRTDRK